MSAFADASLLCALYRQQDNSSEADRLMQRESEAVLVSSLVLFEFRHSLRLQAFRFSKDRAQGFSKAEANRMLEALQANIAGGLFLIPSVEDWAEVYSLAEELSSQHTVQGGYRSFDVLHVATAVHLRAGRFITFDKHQAGLAKAASLDVQP